MCSLSGTEICEYLTIQVHWGVQNWVARAGKHLKMDGARQSHNRIKFGCINKLSTLLTQTTKSRFTISLSDPSLIIALPLQSLHWVLHSSETWLIWPWRVKIRCCSWWFYGRSSLLWQNLVLSRYEDNVWSRFWSLVCSGSRKSARRHVRVAKQNQAQVWPRLKKSKILKTGCLGSVVPLAMLFLLYNRERGK